MGIVPVAVCALLGDALLVEPTPELQNVHVHHPCQVAKADVASLIGGEGLPLFGICVGFAFQFYVWRRIPCHSHLLKDAHDLG